MDSTEDNKNKLVDFLNYFDNSVDRSTIMNHIDVEKLNKLIEIESSYSTLDDFQNKTNLLIDELIKESFEIRSFLSDITDFIVNNCDYTMKNVIIKSISTGFIGNYFKLIAILMEFVYLGLDDKDKKYSFDFNKYLRKFNSSLILECLKKGGGLEYDYFYYKNIYQSKLYLYFNNKIKSELNKYDSESGDFYSKIKGEFEKIESETRTGIDKLETDLNLKLEDLKTLETRINKGIDSAIFVSLDQGYQTLYNDKLNEKKNALIWVYVLGGSVFVPILIKLLSMFFTVYSIYGYALSAAVTFIILYYFRLAIINYNSIKTELTQISLRRNLCAFINGYVDFSKRHEEHMSLSKFENLIFSNIISDEKKVPSSLDSLEQLAKLISTIRGDNSNKTTP
ncbi:hypothetical protein ACE2AL_07180 [Providencia sp. SKLX074055]|uniref:hypothetical protein n=1 Tax=Providencia xihuensis TaxID=3342830 RepID=UPI0035C1A536